jgi:NAD(P)-dependent dehydrogenase (short-subunit alcohol dehydrogenase family)
MNAGRTIIITGGSRGLGRAAVLEFARAGWTVYATGRTRSTLDELRAAGEGVAGSVEIFQGDVASENDNRELVALLERNGARVDAVVHNAGLLGPARTPLADYPASEFRDVLLANVFGPFDLTRQILPRLAQDAALLFISSGASLGPRRGWGAYNVSKMALDGVAGVWALELRDRGIRVFVVDPGKLRTEMRAAAYPDEDPATLPTPEEKAIGLLMIVERGKLSDSGKRLDV